MRVYVKGLGDEQFHFEPCMNASGADLKVMVADKSGIPVEFQTLIFEGRIFDDSTTLENVSEDSTFYLNLDLLGGKKKKKKVFKTKKKGHHRHGKDKLATFKFYNVENDNKVTRTYKSCPECAKGFFMAKHFDRYYCGNCHLTLKLDPATIKANLEKLKNKAKKVDTVVVEEKKDAKGGKGKKGKK